MSTIKSSNEHLTLNADGSSKDIKFQANGVEKASISSTGAFTSTSVNTGTIEADDKVTISYEAGSSDWELESNSGDDFTISRNSTQRLLIDGSNGNVGIGTSPSYKLHTLIGAGEASGVGILNTSGQGLNIYTDSTAANADVSIDQGATGASIIFRQNGTERLRIASDGRGLSQFTAKCWIQADQSNQSINDSHNVSSVADGGTGETVVNFANNMANDDYAVTSGGAKGDIFSTSNRGTASFNMRAVNYSGSNVDVDPVMAIVFGD